MAEVNKNGSARHWMVAAWPGMANVAMIAAAHLVNKLGLKPAGVLPPRGHFDVEQVEVHKGLISRPKQLRNQFYSGIIEGTQTRLTVFMGDAQPSRGVYMFAQELIETARRMGVDRIVTFASMATRLHPSEDPSVYGAATQPELLDELARIDIQTLGEGQIGGLNGVLLGAAAERDLAGIGLLGETPFFAVQLPNPKTAKAIVEAFGALSGIEVNVEELGEQGAQVEQFMLQMLERMQNNPRVEAQPEFEADADEELDMPEASEESAPDQRTSERIERLFEAAKNDRSKGNMLKQELDRLGVFSRYENRFLDLYKAAG